jgi:hypothetical protein
MARSSDDPFHASDIGAILPAANLHRSCGFRADSFVDVPLVAPARSPAPEDDVLALLHEEFCSVLAFPSRLVGNSQWQPAAARLVDASPDFDGLVLHGAAYVQVRDLVVPHEGIDRLMARFMVELDPANVSTLLDATRPEEILQLFGPAAPAGRRLPLPELTRLDHHSLSPDSAVDLASFAIVSRKNAA